MFISTSGFSASRYVLFGNGRYVAANDDGEEIKDKWEIQFNINSYQLDSTVFGNEQTLQAINERMTKLNATNDGFTVLGVQIKGYASPDGAVDFNNELSLQRAQSIRDYLMKISNFPADRFEVEGCGENWQELIQMLNDSPDALAKRSLDIINNTPSGDDPEVRLKQMDGGKCFRYLADNYFPKLRSASTIQLVKLIPIEDTVVETVPVDTAVVDTVVPPVNCGCLPPTIGIRVNALYLAALVPNIGIEFYLGNRISLTCDGLYRWQTFSAAKKNYNISTITGELRYWFRGEKQFNGWYLGVYGNYGEYDLKFTDTGREGYMGGGGLSSGYVFKFNHVKCLFFELGASAGFLHRNYRRYYWYDPCNVFDGHRVKNMFSLTRLLATFVWRF